MNILAMGAHPDDIEYGCGGTLLKAASEGHRVYLHVLTDGAEGGDPIVRRREQEEAASLMGAKDLFWGELKDTAFPSEREVITVLDRCIDKVKPDEVYFNYFDDIHQDHRSLSQCALAASRYVENVIFYEDYTTCNFEPNLFVNIGDVLEKKIQLLAVFNSQISKPFPGDLDMLDSVRAIANYRGYQSKVKYAEGFKNFRFVRKIGVGG